MADPTHPPAASLLPWWWPREPASTFTHLLGVFGSIAALAILVNHASAANQPLHVFSFTVFGIGLILAYGASVLYHWVRLPEPALTRFLRLDRTMIFVLIAATYVPVCVGPLAGPWGWSILSVVCALSVLGIVMQTIWPNAPTWLCTSLYLGLGWVALAGIVPMVERIGFGGVSWLGGGGLSYTAGAVILIIGRPAPAVWFGAHEIFHLFVLGGSTCHFVFMQQHLIA